MTKADAWDIVRDVIRSGANCFDVGEDKLDAYKQLAYITGIVDALSDALDKENDNA